MSTTLAEPRPVDHDAVPTRPDAGGRRSLGRWLPYGGMVAGTAALAVAYSTAEINPDATDLRYALFWFGIACYLVPALLRLYRLGTGRTERLALLVGLGVFTMVPKLLRNNGGPLFFDEFAHWNQAQRLLDDGRFMADNALVRVLDSFPGLHTITVTIEHATGLSTWHVAVALITTAHVLEVIGVYRLALLVTRRTRAASVAAAAYAFNPAFLFINSHFAYQTFALCFLLWSTVWALDLTDTARPRHRRALVGVAVLCALSGMAASLTHHVSGYATTALLILMTAVTWYRGRRDPALRSRLALIGGATGAVAAFAVAWLFIGTRGDPGKVGDYLGQYPIDGLTELFSLGRQGSSRSVFVASGLPAWMRLCAFAAPFLAVGLGAWGWWSRRRDDARHPLFVVIVAVAAAFPASLPFILTTHGSEGAHRSWPFSWLGVSVLFGLGVVAVLERAERRERRLGLTRAALLAATMVVAMGNLALEQNDFYIFPGPWVPGSDTRAYNAELAFVVQWMRAQNPDQLVVTDAFTGASLAAVGDRNPGCRLAAACLLRTAPWALFFSDDIDPVLAEKMKADGFGYVVVDRRLSTGPPRVGFWFNRNEPGAFEFRTAIPEKNLMKFEGRPWAHRVFSTDNIDVYRLDLDRYATPYDIGQNIVTAEQAGTPPPARSGP